jgi:hypothetical protein
MTETTRPAGDPEPEKAEAGDEVPDLPTPPRPLEPGRRRRVLRGRPQP